MTLKSPHILTVVGAFLFLLCPAYAQEGATPETVQKWALCQSDADCVLVGAGCAVKSVNRAFQLEANKYYHELGMRIRCFRAYDPNIDGSIPACQSHKTGCDDGKGGFLPDATCASPLECILLKPEPQLPPATPQNQPRNTQQNMP